MPQRRDAAELPEVLTGASRGPRVRGGGGEGVRVRGWEGGADKQAIILYACWRVGSRNLGSCLRSGEV